MVDRMLSCSKGRGHGQQTNPHYFFQSCTLLCFVVTRADTTTINWPISLNIEYVNNVSSQFKLQALAKLSELSELTKQNCEWGGMALLEEMGGGIDPSNC